MIIPHFFAPELKLLPQPMKFEDWAAIKTARGGAQPSQDRFARGSSTSDTPEIVVGPPRDVSAWGHECGRGFVRDARFGPGQVIKGTNRAKSRKNRAVSNWDGVKPLESKIGAPL